MNVSRINSVPSFKGYIELSVRDERGHHYSKQKINTDDITKITEDSEWCFIETKNNEYNYFYNNSSTHSDIRRIQSATNFNKVLNAYMAAKVGDKNFTVKLT